MTVFAHYTSSEGGKWTPWAGGDIDGRSLKKRDRSAVELNGVKVHSLKADDGREWDCINGWRADAQVPAMNGDTSREPEDVIEAWVEATTKLKVEMEASLIADGKAYIAPEIRERAQAYAERVWNGQAADLKRAERIARVERALQGQNLPTDGIRYPGNSEDDWTEEDEKPVTWRKPA